MMVNNVITGNTCEEASGGITCDSASPTVINNTIVGNSASGGMTAFQVGGIACRDHSSPTVINTILWSNSPTEIFVDASSTIDITYSDIQDSWPGDGNINVDPLFIDAANDDYHLSDYSLCIGAPATDIEGNPRGTPPDMGAYENSLDTRLTTIYVSTTGSNETGDGSEEHPYKTIQKGIDIAINGDTVQAGD